MRVYDIIIIGGGPAGITAGIYAARKKLDILILSKDVGGQVFVSWEIENWPGVKHTTGPELTKAFEAHLNSLCDGVQVGEEVLEISRLKDRFKVKTSKNAYYSKTVIITTGTKPRKLDIKGEKEFEGRGLTYCATCDAPLYSNKDVAVIGGGNSGMEASLQLVNIARHIYLIHRSEKLKGDPIMADKLEKSDKVTVILNASTKEIFGDKVVKGFKVDVKGEGERTIEVQGVFVEIGAKPVQIPVKSDTPLKLNTWGEIVVDEHSATNIPGLFAAGDVTSVPEKQIVVAAGQGCVACLSAFKYISTLKE